MQLLSAHAALGLLIAVVVLLILVAIGLPWFVALPVAGLAGWLLVQTVFKDFADRAEHWLTTPK